MKVINRRVRRSLCSSIAILIAVPVAIQATTYTWSGGGATNNWSAIGNWSPATPSATAASNVLVFSGTSRLTNVANYGQTVQVMSLQFSGTAGAFNLSGSPLNFQTGTAAPTMVQSSGSAQTVANAVTFSNDLVLSGAGAGRLNLNGAVDGTGVLTKTSSGILGFGGAVSIPGININAGSVDFPAGSSSTSARIQVGNGADFTLNGGSVNTGAGTYFQVGSSAGTAAAELNSGSLTSSETDIGNVSGATAKVTQDGGTHTVSGGLYLGVTANSTGNYTLNAGGTLSTMRTFVGYLGTGVFTQNGGTHTVAQSLRLGELASAGNTSTYFFNGGTLITPEISTNSLALGASVFNFNGGTLMPASATSVLMHNLGQANVQAGGAIIDSNGFNATLGQPLLHATALGSTLDGGLTKLGAGTLTLTGASTYTGVTKANEGILEIGLGGAIANSFAQVNPGATLLVSPGGSYDAGTGVYISVGQTAGPTPAILAQTGGSVQSTAMDVGNAPGSTGVYNQSGGTTTVSTQLTVGLNAGATGTYNLSGTGTLNAPAAIIGVSASGTMNQSGGTFNGSQVNLGQSATGTGTYLLSGGLLQPVGYLAIGISGTGTLKQSGGSFTTSDPLYIGFNATSHGGYELSDGTASLGGSVLLGLGGAGSLVQSGGVMTIGVSLQIGVNANSMGAYRLAGGLLRAKAIIGGAGASAFSFDGGTLQLTAATSNPFSNIGTLQVLPGGAKIDTNGFAVTIGTNLTHDSSEAGGLTRDGGLTKLGTGNLTLTANNSFNGGVTVAEGTLTVAGDANLGAGNGPVNLLNAGRLIFSSSSVATARSFNLTNAILAPPVNGSLLYNGSSINGGFLGGNGSGSAHQWGDGVTVNGSTVLPGTSVLQTSGTAVLNGVTLSGQLTQGIPAVLDFNSGYISPAGNVNIGGTMNTGGVEVLGRIAISGTVNNTNTALVFGYGASATLTSSGHLNAASGTSIEFNGAKLDNAGTITGVLNINAGSSVTGAGSFGSATVQPGGVLSPGNSPGTASFDNLTLEAGSVYRFELNSSVANPGVSQDLLNIADTLTIGSGGALVLHLVSLTPGNTPGLLSDFDPGAPYSFTLATAGNVLSGFAADRFSIETSEFANDLKGGRFFITESTNQQSLQLNFVPVPEPASLSLLLGAAAVMGAGRFRRRAS